MIFLAILGKPTILGSIKFTREDPDTIATSDNETNLKQQLMCEMSLDKLTYADYRVILKGVKSLDIEVK